MTDELTVAELDEIVTALQYARRSIENCTSYPSYEYRRQRLDENHALLTKVRAWRKKAKETTK